MKNYLNLLTSKIILYVILPVSLLSAYLLLGEQSYVPRLGVTLMLLLVGSTWLWILQKLHKVRLSLYWLILVVLYMLNAFGPLFTTSASIMNILFGAVVLFLLNIETFGTNWWQHGVGSFFAIKIFDVLTAKIVGIFEAILNIVKFPPGIKSKIDIKSTLGTGIIFLIFGIPVLLIVIGFLSNSSEMFAELMSNIDLGIGGFAINFARVIVAGFVFYWLVTELMFVRKQLEGRSTNVAAPLKSESLMNSVSGAALITTVLLNVFYLTFVVIQVQYDFNNLQELISQENIESYSNLAVGRFWELIAVSMINIALLLVANRAWHQIKNSTQKLLTYVNVGWLMLNTALLIFSSWQRLNLYIGGYGFTYLRFMAYVFIPFLLTIAALKTWGFYAKQMRNAFKWNLLILLLFLGFWNIVPETFLINSINLNLHNNEVIQVYDPMYNVPLNYSYDDYYFQRGHWDYENDVQDDDGLLTAVRALNESKLTRDIEVRYLDGYFQDFLDSKPENWRDWSVMNWLIEQKLSQHYEMQ